MVAVVVLLVAVLPPAEVLAAGAADDGEGEVELLELHAVTAAAAARAAAPRATARLRAWTVLFICLP